MRSQTDQLREALIGSVSHELRTPLASILGSATVLAEAPALKSEPKLQALVADVRSEAERLNNDIQNLLDATRISSDGIKPRIEWADPADIIDTAVERCKRRLSGHNMVMNVPADLPLIHVDPMLVTQALVQIVRQRRQIFAARHHRDACRARARRPHDPERQRRRRRHYRRRTAADIWDRFVRGERNTTTTSGSGLGLWIAQAFIAANGGKMNAVSEGPGKGATMAIELPVTQAAVPQMESDADE